MYVFICRLLARILQENYPYIAKVSDRIAGLGWGWKATLSVHVSKHNQLVPLLLCASGLHPLGEPSQQSHCHGLKSAEMQTPIPYFSEVWWGGQVKEE